MRFQMGHADSVSAGICKWVTGLWVVVRHGAVCAATLSTVVTGAK